MISEYILNSKKKSKKKLKKVKKVKKHKKKRGQNPENKDIANFKWLDGNPAITNTSWWGGQGRGKEPSGDGVLHTQTNKHRNKAYDAFFFEFSILHSFL